MSYQNLKSMTLIWHLNEFVIYEIGKYLTGYIITPFSFHRFLIEEWKQTVTGDFFRNGRMVEILALHRNLVVWKTFLGYLLKPAKIFLVMLAEFFFKFCVGGWFFSFNNNMKVKAGIIFRLFIFQSDNFS